MSPRADRPAMLLTRHFFDQLFRFGVLSDAGAMAFTRTLLGAIAALLAFGLLLLRIYASKYAYLNGLPVPDAYRRALPPDHAFLIALPMWVAAVVSLLIGHALFPDRTDYQVLMPLPLTRRTIFLARLAAVAAFTGIFVAASHVALLPLVLLISTGRWAEGIWWMHAGVFEAASLSGSAFAVLFMTAAQGTLIWLSGRHAASATAVVRSGLFFGLVAVLPLVLRWPAAGEAFATQAAWLYAAPPAWFVGLEDGILGHAPAGPHGLAVMAVAGTAGVAALATGTYWALYQTFDRVLRPADSGRPRRSLGAARTPFASVRLWRRPALAAAVRGFVLATFRRAPLQQGTLVAIGAIGVGLVVHAFAAAGVAGWALGRAPLSSHVINALTWAPLPLMFATCLAVRLAFALPVELGANWIFRVTEDEHRRAAPLAAAAALLVTLGVTLPVVAVLPLLAKAVGWLAIPVLGAQWLWGALFAECVLRAWARLPFTCSYLPGKGFVPQMILSGLLSFLVFSGVGLAIGHVMLLGARAVPVSLVLAAVETGALLALRQRRLARWRDTPIEFEDALPSEVQGLRLD